MYNKIMELDYSDENRRTECPKYDCRKNDCENCCITYNSIPASVTEQYPVTNGTFCNKVVHYEETNKTYLFTADGIPVLLNKGEE